MPTYQYACTACQHRFEAVQAFTDDSLTVCPECGGSLRKVYGSVGVVFKGSGFYRTDSRTGAVNPAPAAGSDEPAGDKGGDKGSDKGSEKSGEKSGGEKKAAAGAGSADSGSKAASTSSSSSSTGGSSGSKAAAG